MNVGIINTASYLPPKVNTNETVCNHIEGLTQKWIIEKTGIKRRFHVEGPTPASQMACTVAHKLLSKEGVKKEDIGLVVVCTFSHDLMFPPLSALVHRALGLSMDCQIMDINVNCVGLITGTTIAAERMRSDLLIKNAIVIGVEVLSKYVDRSDKFTAPFFSDGASGVLLGRVGDQHGFMTSAFATDSSVYCDVKCVRGGHIYQNGKATWTQAITNIPFILRKVWYNLDEIDFFIFHQANKVLIEYIMEKMRIPHEKTYTNVEEIGNTGAASIGIALDEATKKGLIKRDSKLCLVGVGAGFNFGANLWRMQ
jgi:3-oxoacyl-[acyl-carrier-protein] synthase-3